MVDLLLADTPEHVVLPPEPAYEDAVDNPTAQSEREICTRKEQAKTAWKNNCLSLETLGVLSGNKPWKACDLYLSLGTEGRRGFNSKHSVANLDEILTKILWDILNKTFIHINNITFDRYLFLKLKQQKAEPIEKFYGQHAERRHSKPASERDGGTR